MIDEGDGAEPKNKGPANDATPGVTTDAYVTGTATSSASHGETPADDKNAHDKNAHDKNADGKAAESKGDQGKDDEGKDDGDRDTGEKKTRWNKKFGRELALIVVAALVLTLLLKAFAVQVYQIPSDSMDNTLRPYDRVLVNKLVYHFRNIARGDVIVFSGANSWGDLNGQPIPAPPSNPIQSFFDAALADLGFHGNNTFYIKRVIGLPGDRVACCTNGMVTVNGVPLHETGFIYPDRPAAPFPFSATVPAGRLWVMGDNREDSDDSLLHDRSGSPYSGTIPENEVVGRAFLKVWPPSRFGDLPIPDTFKQAALNTASAALDWPATSGTAAVALTTPLLIWRYRIGLGLRPRPRSRRRVLQLRRARAGGRRRGPRRDR
jgi:signal peptidase I